MADNRATAMQFLQGKGLTRAQAAGVVGSLMQESGLSTGAKNSSSGALGIGQWLGGRKTNLLKSGKAGSLRGQLDFLWGELEGPESAALDRLKGAHSVEDAAAAFTWGFERPGRAEANMANRVKQGRAALGLGDDSGGTPTGDTGTATTTVTSPSVVAALDTLPPPEKKQPPQTAIEAPSFAAKPILSSVIQTTAPEKKPSVLDSLNTLAKIQEPQTTTTTTTSEDGAAPATTSGGGGTKGSKVLELIYNDGGKGYGIKDGATVEGSQTFSAVWGGHRDHVHVAAGPKTVVALGNLAQDMGLHVGENPHFGGVDPVHVPGSYHYKGEAIDVSGDPSKMAAFAKRVARYNRTHSL